MHEAQGDRVGNLAELLASRAENWRKSGRPCVQRRTFVRPSDASRRLASFCASIRSTGVFALTLRGSPSGEQPPPMNQGRGRLRRAWQRRISRVTPDRRWRTRIRCSTSAFLQTRAQAFDVAGRAAAAGARVGLLGSRDDHRPPALDPRASFLAGTGQLSHWRGMVVATAARWLWVNEVERTCRCPVTPVWGP